MNYYNVLLAKKTNRVLQFGSLYERLFETWINRARQILKDLPTGAISTVNDAAELPLNALKVSVEAVQSGSGTPSPSNIRPIIGWDSGEIVNKSRNLVANKNDYVMTIAPNIDDTIPAFSISIQAGKTYTVSCHQDNNIPTSVRNTLQIGVNGTNLYEENAGSNNYHQEAGVHKVTFTANSDQICHARFWGHTLSTQSTYSQWQIEESPDFTTYQPYWTPITTTLNFPQTIYGAEWDVVNGVLSQTKYAIDLGDLNWSKSPSRWYASVPNNHKSYSADQTPYLLTDGLKYELIPKSSNELSGIAGSNEASFGANSESSTLVWYVDLNVAQDGAEFASFVSGQKLVYKLATPTTIDLSPLSIRLLEGTNNILADCGEVLSGKYWANV